MRLSVDFSKSIIRAQPIGDTGCFSITATSRLNCAGVKAVSRSAYSKRRETSRENRRARRAMHCVGVSNVVPSAISTPWLHARPRLSKITPLGIHQHGHWALEPDWKLCTHRGRLFRGADVWDVVPGTSNRPLIFAPRVPDLQMNTVRIRLISFGRSCTKATKASLLDQVCIVRLQPNDAFIRCTANNPALAPTNRDGFLLAGCVQVKRPSFHHARVDA